MKYKRTDANQAAIMEALRTRGTISVVDLSSVGRGCPDLLIGWGGTACALVEVKNLDGRGDRFTEAEERFYSHWQGIPVIVAHTVDDILEVI